jgi:two-component system sensor histidine kinase SenX3
LPAADPRSAAAAVSVITIPRVDPVMALAALAAGALIMGAVLWWAAAWRRSRRRRHLPRDPVPPAVATDLARRMLEVIRHGAVVVDRSNSVVLANVAARQMGLVRDGRLTVADLRVAAGAARRHGEQQASVVDLPGGRIGRDPMAVVARVAPLDDLGHVAFLIEDVTESRRLEDVRRDFVANVSHELKTPVGALTLLAEAVADAADDPVAVRRFADRMQHEGIRLGRLVTELIELSRLQGADPLPTARVVAVDRLVAEAVDRTRLAAESAGIGVVAGGEHGLIVSGEEGQLITALANLVDNAIAYSPPGTRVAVGTRLRRSSAAEPGDWVEISVSDQGIGIAESDLERVFERFFRSDPARSRATGGTGLGLAIVKHIATNHGGSVSVWSVEGSGSTFTLRLPADRRLAEWASESEQPVRSVATGGADRRPAAESRGMT